MNTQNNIPQNDIPQNDISSFVKATFAEATLKGNTKLALGGNIETQITNNIKLDEEFKKTYGATIKSQHTVVIANALEILKNMRKQFENNFETIRDFENGRE